MSKEEALKLAVEKGLDLIETAPMANPPVAKLISFDKFRYQQTKEEKKNRQKKSGNELKQVRISARAAKNDLNIKAKKVDEFLEENHTVEIDMVLRGREKYNRDWAKTKMSEFMTMIGHEYKVTSPEKFVGRGMSVQIMKK
jgi:translation initiation factor IF-3